MRIAMVSYAYLTVPDGTIIAADGFIHLPDGTLLKPFITIERNETDDLTTSQLETIGCELEYDGTETSIVAVYRPHP